MNLFLQSQCRKIRKDVDRPNMLDLHVTRQRILPPEFRNITVQVIKQGIP
jgi:hypothetical protein